MCPRDNARNGPAPKSRTKNGGFFTSRFISARPILSLAMIASHLQILEVPEN